MLAATLQFDGHTERAAAFAREALELTTAGGNVMAAVQCHGALAISSLTSGDMTGLRTHLTELAALVRDGSDADPPSCGGWPRLWPVAKAAIPRRCGSPVQLRLPSKEVDSPSTRWCRASRGRGRKPPAPPSGGPAPVSSRTKAPS